VVLLIVAAVLATARIVPGLFDGSVGREDVEKAGERAMLYSGAGVADVSCPGDLDRSTGATIVCSYTDVVTETVRAATAPGSAHKPAVGRVEIRITGFRRSSHLRRSTSVPEFSARVIEPAE
jgi:hypothetical protein